MRYFPPQKQLCKNVQGIDRTHIMLLQNLWAESSEPGEGACERDSEHRGGLRRKLQWASPERHQSTTNTPEMRVETDKEGTRRKGEERGGVREGGSDASLLYFRLIGLPLPSLHLFPLSDSPSTPASLCICALTHRTPVENKIRWKKTHLKLPIMLGKLYIGLIRYVHSKTFFLCFNVCM